MTKDELIKAGFVQLTENYFMPAEDQMFSRALLSYTKDGDDNYYVLWAEDFSSACIWTRPRHIIEPEETT